MISNFPRWVERRLPLPGPRLRIAGELASSRAVIEEVFNPLLREHTIFRIAVSAPTAEDLRRAEVIAGAVHDGIEAAAKTYDFPDHGLSAPSDCLRLEILEIVPSGQEPVAVDGLHFGKQLALRAGRLVFGSTKTVGPVGYYVTSATRPFQPFLSSLKRSLRAAYERLFRSFRALSKLPRVHANVTISSPPS